MVLCAPPTANITSFDAANGGTDARQGTVGDTINDAGTIAGLYSGGRKTT
jgi:hypothetical protein